MKPDPTNDWMDRAFRLAYFVHGEPQTAVQIAARAMNKLQLAATAQGKRLYYRLTGRAGSRKSRNKVSLSQPHLLQRLVYVESEEYERQKESTMHTSESQKLATHADLVVHFIKHLVRITTRRNSFYVTLGLSRLLYNYTTPETMELYNVVVQDPDRVHDDYYYRSRKSVLLKELKERFGELIEIATAARGEQRWRSSTDQQTNAPLVRECLAWFTPWSTPCVVPHPFDPLNDTINELNFEGRHPDEEHEVEVNRIHATLHPDCFARLVRATGFESPDERLELPRFLLATGSDNGGSSSRTPPPMSDEERRTINELLGQEASRRKAAAASGLFRVLVDGHERGRIEVASCSSVGVMLEQGAELVEVYGSDRRGGAVLLAVHLLDLSDKGDATAHITSEAGQRFSFNIELLTDRPVEDKSARLTVTVRETRPSRIAAVALQKYWKLVAGTMAEPGVLGKPAAVLGLLLLLTIGWLVWFRNEESKREVARNDAPPGVSSPVPSPTAKAAENIPPQQTPMLVKQRQPKRSIPSPSRNEVRRDDSSVARTLIPDTNRDVDGSETRGSWNRELMGKPLKDIRRVYIQAADDDSVGTELVTELRGRLATNPDVQYADLDAADAALKVSVTRATAIPGDKRVLAIIRAVNVNGYVVWPTSRRGASWRYVGEVNDVAARVVADLSRAIKEARK